MRQSLYRTLHPEVFQGRGRTRGYFEGWYFKHVSRGRGGIWSVIPGLAWDRDGEGHAFIQLIDGSAGSTEYFLFPAEAFSASERELEISIGPNVFTRNGIRLDLDDGSRRVQAELSYADPVPYPGTLSAPGVMGWYSWVPFMECYHGIVSLDHRVEGYISTNGARHDLSGGDGYIEKDWGRSFPSAWIWLQTNSFQEPGTSVSFSIARIPWLTGRFTGFLCVFMHRGTVLTFATWNGARITGQNYRGDELTFDIRNREYRLAFFVHRNASGELMAPVEGKMERRISESIDAVIEVTLLDRLGIELFRGIGTAGGAEVVGDVRELLAGIPETGAAGTGP